MAKSPPKAAVKKTTAKSAPKRRKVNKSKAIREFKAKNPKLGPTEIAQALSAKGIKVSPPQVSNALGSVKKKKVKKRGVRSSSASVASSNQVSLDSLIDAQKFVDKVGGVDAAKGLLGAIEKLSK